MHLKFEIEMVPLEKLKEMEMNAKLHTEEQVRHIAQSIAEFGFTQPIIVDEKNTILAGHGRTLAAKALGLKEVPVRRVTGLKKHQKIALNLADNRLQQATDVDEEALEKLLLEIAESGYDMTQFGVELSEVSAVDIQRVAAEVDPSFGLIKQYAIIFPTELFDATVQRLDAAMKRMQSGRTTRKWQNHTEVVIGLLKFWEEHENVRGEARHEC